MKQTKFDMNIHPCIFTSPPNSINILFNTMTPQRASEYQLF